nr:MAG TPA: hypothetical protein [Bacteriophage sp.]
MDKIFSKGVESPRIEGGVIKWYYGDTFTIELTINLARDGEEIHYAPTDKIVVSFYNAKKENIYSFVCTNIGDDNMCTLKFTKDVSNRFWVGTHTFCIKYITEDNAEGEDIDITTISAFSKVVVEPCH